MNNLFLLLINYGGGWELYTMNPQDCEYWKEYIIEMKKSYPSWDFQIVKMVNNM